MYGVMQQRFVLFTFVTFISVILSIWAAIKTSVINPDAICYLQSAAEIEKGFSSAIHLCEQAKWPFYSALIFSVTKLAHVSYLASAFSLNGLFSLLTVIAFIMIVNALSKSMRVLWLASVVILLAHEFNSIRTDIARDHGFWAFYLFSLFFSFAIFKVLDYDVHYCGVLRSLLPVCFVSKA